MTIVLGFHANDGLLLCADMQRTVGDMKTYDGKIVETIFHDSGVVMAVAGAGNDDYVRCARQALTKIVPTGLSFTELEQEMKKRLLNFFAEHLAPWAYFPAEDRPAVDLLIGITGRSIPPALFHYEGTAFSRVSSKAIGSGVLLAVDMINRYCHGGKTRSLEELTAIAIYILSQVKERVHGCGGPTHLVALRKGGDIGWIDFEKIKITEQKLSAIAEKKDRQLVDRLIATPPRFDWLSEHSRRSISQKSERAL